MREVEGFEVGGLAIKVEDLGAQGEARVGVVLRLDPVDRLSEFLPKGGFIVRCAEPKRVFEAVDALDMAAQSQLQLRELSPWRGIFEGFDGSTFEGFFFAFLRRFRVERQRGGGGGAWRWDLDDRCVERLGFWVAFGLCVCSRLFAWWLGRGRWRGDRGGGTMRQLGEGGEVEDAALEHALQGVLGALHEVIDEGV